jgi:2-dehydro-3-deoxy-D-arabinonate dehydratase
MQLCKVRLPSDETRAGIFEGQTVRVLATACLDIVLHSADPAATALALACEQVSASEVTLLPPVDRQEVWAAGVTYTRSREARERESEGAARFYDLVYRAERPELFLKATASRVVGPGGTVHIRRDSKWNVPEPELALVISPTLRIVGFTVGNDMSSRDIEGENPLYLPQAKVYDHSCAVGPVITLATAMPPRERIEIRLAIERAGNQVFEGATSAGSMARPLEDLVSWLGRETSFPDGAILLTGTGVVPPDDFTLQPGDVVHIDVAGVGRLTNTVHQAGRGPG